MYTLSFLPLAQFWSWGKRNISTAAKNLVQIYLRKKGKSIFLLFRIFFITLLHDSEWNILAILATSKLEYKWISVKWSMNYPSTDFQTRLFLELLNKKKYCCLISLKTYFKKSKTSQSQTPWKKQQEVSKASWNP